MSVHIDEGRNVMIALIMFGVFAIIAKIVLDTCGVFPWICGLDYIDLGIRCWRAIGSTEMNCSVAASVNGSMCPLINPLPK